MKIYKVAFTNYYDDGSAHSQVYVNPKLDVVVLELPVDVKRYPRIQQALLVDDVKVQNDWSNETHTLYRYSSFLWAHTDEWVVEEGGDPDDGWGYETRYNAYLVVVPKIRESVEEWEGTIEMRGLDTKREYECRRVGSVVLPPHVVRDVVPLPGDCEGYLRRLVRALEGDPRVLQRPLGETPNRFWE